MHPVDRLARYCAEHKLSYSIEGPDEDGRHTGRVYTGWPVSLAEASGDSPASAARSVFAKTVNERRRAAA